MKFRDKVLTVSLVGLLCGGVDASETGNLHTEKASLAASRASAVDLSHAQKAVLDRTFSKFRVVSSCRGNFSGNSDDELVLVIALSDSGKTPRQEAVRTGLIFENGSWIIHQIDHELMRDESISHSHSHPLGWNYAFDQNGFQGETKCNVILEKIQEFNDDGGRLLGRKPFFKVARNGSAGNSTVCFGTSAQYNNWDCIAYDQKDKRFRLWYQQVFAD